MMLPTFRRYALLTALTLFSGTLALAQEPALLPVLSLPLHQDFSTSVDGWFTAGNVGKVSMMSSPIAINSAHGALQLDYNVAQGDVAFFALNVSPGAFTKATKFRFAVRADYATTVAFGLQEKDGGRYMAYFAVPKDDWQIVELAPSDFILADGPADPKDPDNKLDLDQINLVGMTDVDQIWAQSGGVANDLFGVKLGPHKLYLADLNISAGSAGVATIVPDSIDDFSHPQVDWLVIGGAHAMTYSRGASRGRGMQVKYDQAPGKIVGLLRNVRSKQFVGGTRLAFSVASNKPATLIVQLEETGGGKYSATTYVPAGASAPVSVSIPFADFHEADDSKDANHKLDLDQIDHVILIDAGGMMGTVTETAANTLYVADLHVVR